MYRPDKIMKAGTWADPDFNGAQALQRRRPHRGHRHERADPDLALDGADGVRPRVPEPDAAARRHRARERRHVDLGRHRPDEGRAARRDLEPRHRDVDDGRLAHERARVPLDGAAASGRPRADGRRRRAPGPRAPTRRTPRSTRRRTCSRARGRRSARAPGGASYGSSFDVTTPDAAQITKVSLIRSPSVTHAFDQNQRFQFLNFTQGSGKITVQAPANANLAPPGDYMLFIVERERRAVRRARSSASRRLATSPRRPRRRASTANADVGAGRPDVERRRPTRAAIANYNVYRSTTPGFTPSAGEPDRPADRRRATPTSAVTAGTYYYKVTADDTAGNTSARLERGRRAVVPSGPLPGLVAAYGFDEGSGTTTADQSGQRQHGHARRTRPGRPRQVRQGALLQRHERLGRRSPDSNSLDLTTGMTLEAWVKPTTLGSAFRTRRRQGAARRTSSTASTRNQSGQQPAAVGQVHVGGVQGLLTAPPALPPARGRISPRPTTARPCASTSTARRSRRSPSAGSIAHARRRRCEIGGNSIWGE